MLWTLRDHLLLFVFHNKYQKKILNFVGIQAPRMKTIDSKESDIVADIKLLKEWFTESYLENLVNKETKRKHFKFPR